MRKLAPVTTGELLLEEFLKPMGLSQYRLAKVIDVPAQRISEIIANKRGILTLTYDCAGFLCSLTAIGYVHKPPMI